MSVCTVNIYLKLDFDTDTLLTIRPITHLMILICWCIFKVRISVKLAKQQHVTGVIMAFI